jgi:dTDP-4-dehydrorhamnose reductase
MEARVLILGGTGMLGRAALSVFAERGFALQATSRSLDDVSDDLRSVFSVFDASTDSLAEIVNGLGPGDYVMNCIGIIKPYIADGEADSRLRAIRINAEFPYELVRLAEQQGFRVIQIATDCVYAGDVGGYLESAPHDAEDVYGKTKSLGEIPSPSMLNLRSSIIGPEQKGKLSLLEWVLAHDDGSSFTGYTDHRWNGVTARTFALVAAGIIETGNPIAGNIHLVPADIVTKYELSRIILDVFDRPRVAVKETTTSHPIDRTLATEHPDVNARLWRDAGYAEPPLIAQMVRELVTDEPTDLKGRTA